MSSNPVSGLGFAGQSRYSSDHVVGGCHVIGRREVSTIQLDECSAAEERGSLITLCECVSLPDCMQQRRGKHGNVSLTFVCPEISTSPKSAFQQTGVAQNVRLSSFLDCDPIEFDDGRNRQPSRLVHLANSAIVFL